MKQTFEILKNSIDKNRLFNNVKEVSSFHRIQATPGYRQEANYVCDKLIKEGYLFSLYLDDTFTGEITELYLFSTIFIYKNNEFFDMIINSKEKIPGRIIVL